MSRDDDVVRPQYASAVHSPSKVPTSKTKRHIRWRRIRRLSGLVLLGSIFGLVIVAFLKFADGPAEATIGRSPRPTLKTPVVTVTGTAVMSGPMVELSYPAMFDAAQQLSLSGETFERYILSSKSNFARSIAVSVRALPSGLLADDSSYRFRQLNTADYRQSTDKVEGEAVAVMMKNDHQEYTLFWSHQGKLLTIAIVSTNPKDDVEAIAQTVKKGTRWRR